MNFFQATLIFLSFDSHIGLGLFQLMLLSINQTPKPIKTVKKTPSKLEPKLKRSKTETNIYFSNRDSKAATGNIIYQKKNAAENWNLFRFQDVLKICVSIL